MKALRADYVCDWCDEVATVQIDPKHEARHELPPGWGVLLFTVRPGDPSVEEWSKHKYHACSRNCAGEILHDRYPRKEPFYEAAPSRSTGGTDG